MSEVDKPVEEATALLAAGREAQALEILGTAADATHDPGLLREIHELAAATHEASRGFHKIEWQRLMIATEPQTTAPTST